ncbi:hypothetical protein ON010_g15278 [Phytophthora cinnamomi]|nr:hypothetical protein ON010_g15278 [Phytophthora cinnamomi]
MRSWQSGPWDSPNYAFKSTPRPEPRWVTWTGSRAYTPILYLLSRSQTPTQRHRLRWAEFDPSRGGWTDASPAVSAWAPLPEAPTAIHRSAEVGERDPRTVDTPNRASSSSNSVEADLSSSEQLLVSPANVFGLQQDRFVGKSNARRGS